MRLADVARAYLELQRLVSNAIGPSVVSKAAPNEATTGTHNDMPYLRLGPCDASQR
ncbi:hypothetical protein CTKZ_17390 [Cellulomonas algicola]|uniref:Uncharacterized protein n=1 Tax=Cellulomonas algicola TaxID=2071633 RepID=A0A401UZQ8_9CELL|nr:hypothetical protein CTKZ_17390 [Cellulomonas algicola]